MTFRRLKSKKTNNLSDPNEGGLNCQLSGQNHAKKYFNILF